MIDFHSHVLPAVDDGSKSLEQSLQMLDASVQQGVTHMVATPHFYASRMDPDVFLEQRQRAFDQILQQPAPMPQLLLGAEVAYYGNISRSEAIGRFRIDRSNLVLVEMPFTTWSDRMIEDLCLLQDRQGLIPVLAHVERYRQKDQFLRYQDELVENGILCQCNAEAFEGFWAARWALKQLREGAVQLLGSDCHNTDSRPQKLGIAAQTIANKLGRSVLERMDELAFQLLKLDM